jgi:hypothetical protein
VNMLPENEISIVELVHIKFDFLKSINENVA